MTQFEETRSPMTRARHGMLGGVCAGLADRFGIEVAFMRLAWVAMLCLFGTGALLYLALWAVLPRAGDVPSEGFLWEQRSDGSHKPPLRRTLIDRKISGVCGGLARYWDMDPSVVRLIALSLFVLSAGSATLVYIAAAIVIQPNEVSTQLNVSQQSTFRG